MQPSGPDIIADEQFQYLVGKKASFVTLPRSCHRLYLVESGLFSFAALSPQAKVAIRTVANSNKSQIFLLGRSRYFVMQKTCKLDWVKILSSITLPAKSRGYELRTEIGQIGMAHES